MEDIHKMIWHAERFESIYDYSEYYYVDGNPTIWRYMNLEKFKSILNKKALYFSHPQQFRENGDNLEGSISLWEINRKMDDVFRTKKEVRAYLEEVKSFQSYAGISCWHMNEFESAAMWDLYTHNCNGIAIRTDYKSVVPSVLDDRFAIFSAAVQYIDPNNQMTSDNIFDRLFFKRKSFQYENEVRFMIVAGRIHARYLEDKFHDEGYRDSEIEEKINELEQRSLDIEDSKWNFVSVDLNRLIKNVFVHPKAEKKFVNEIKNLVIENGLDPSIVIQSSLYSDYIY